MTKSQACKRSRAAALAGLGLLLGIGVTGCQIDVGGQTLPSAWYQQAQVRYDAPGPEFKLAREAAAMKAAASEESQQAPQSASQPARMKTAWDESPTTR